MTFTPTAGRLALVYSTLFLTVGILLPYLPVWLADRGLGAEAIGLLIGISVSMKVIVNPIAAAFADRLGISKPIILGCVGSAFFTFLPLHLVINFWPIFAICFVFFAFWSPLFPLIDGVAVRATSQGKIDYGRVRLWGSLAFIGASIGAGHAIDIAGPPVFYWLMVGAVGTMALCCMALPSESMARPESQTLVAVALLRDPAFRIFLATVALTQASHAPYYGFGTLHWLSLGLSETTIGLLWGWGVVAEIILFAAAIRLFERWTPVAMLAVGATGSVIRWTFMAFDPGIMPLFALQTMHAMSFGMIQLGGIRYLAERHPQQQSSSAVALVTSATGLTTGCVLLVMGQAYAAYQGLAYLGAAILAAGGILLAVMLARR